MPHTGWLVRGPRPRVQRPAGVWSRRQRGARTEHGLVCSAGTEMPSRLPPPPFRGAGQGRARLRDETHVGQGSSRAQLWAPGRAGALRSWRAPRLHWSLLAGQPPGNPGPSATPGQPATLQEELRALPCPPRSRPGHQDLDTTWQDGCGRYLQASLPTLEGPCRCRSVRLSPPQPYVGLPSC